MLIFFGGINLKYIFDTIITTNEGIGFDKRQLVVVAQFCDPHVSNLSKTKYLRKRDLLFTQQVPLFLCVLYLQHRKDVARSVYTIILFNQLILLHHDKTEEILPG